MAEAVLVGDIGGTNARLALADPRSIRLGAIATYEVARFPSLAVLLRTHLAREPQPVRAACLAVAGPMIGDLREVSNVEGWSFRPEEVRRELGLERLLTINDFEALALALPYLSGGDVRQLGGRPPAPRGVKLVVGPGTGLGAGVLVPAGSAGWRAIPGEGGHVTLPVETAREHAIRRVLSPDDAHLSTEDVISGPGLVRLYRAIARLDGLAAPAGTPAEVASAGLAGHDRAASLALEHLVTWLGRWAGDLALVLLPAGGIYVGGGVARSIAGLLAGGGLRRAFDDKGRMRHVVEPLPLLLIEAEAPALLGAAAAFADLAGA